MTTNEPKDTAKRLRAKELGAIANELTHRVVEVTTPVYKLNAREEPEAIGTGVLVQLAGMRFLLTASHVLEAPLRTGILLQVGTSVLPLAGEVTRLFGTGTPGARLDPVDTCIVHLAGDAWQQANPSAFLTWPELDDAPSAPARQAYGLAGYPATRQRKAIDGLTVTASMYRVAGLECPATLYRSLKCDPNTSLLVGFVKRRTWGPDGLKTAPDLYGASGCGLWRFGRHLRQATQPPVLSGIGVAWVHKGRHQHVRGTRIRPILAGIGQQYSEVQEFIREQVQEAT